MTKGKKVKDLMIPLEDYPHIPNWFTLRQAMAIVREAAVKFEGAFEPRAALVFDEKYQLMGILTLRNMIKALEPEFLRETSLVKRDPDLTGSLGDLLGPNLKEHSQRPVSEVMIPIQVTVDDNAPISKALYLMIKENVGRMPVMQDNKVAGMIRLTDLFGEIAAVVLDD
jgi:CBS domain-containing protein